MELFNSDIISEYSEWKSANKDSFTWWNYVNLKADINAALGLAKFFYPEIIEKDGGIFLKDSFNRKK